MKPLITFDKKRVGHKILNTPLLMLVLPPRIKRKKQEGKKSPVLQSVDALLQKKHLLRDLRLE